MTRRTKQTNTTEFSTGLALGIIYASITMLTTLGFVFLLPLIYTVSGGVL